MAFATNRVTQLKTWVQDHDVAAITIFFKEVDLKLETHDTSYDLFKKAMIWCNEYDSFEVGKEIYYQFDQQLHIIADDLPWYIELLMNNFPNKVLIFMDSKMQIGVLFSEIVTVLIDHFDRPESVIALRKAVQICGMPLLKDLQVYYNTSRLEENEHVSEYLEHLLRKEYKWKEYAPIPEWVFPATGEVPYEDQLTIPEEPEYVSVDITDTEKVVRILLKATTDEGELYKYNKKKLTQFVKQMPKNIVQGWTDSIVNEYLMAEAFTNKEYFRMFGPALPFGSIYEIENRYGGSRMLLSEEKERTDSDFDPATLAISTWFKGSCDKCFRKIRRKYHAIRRPLMYGGWLGCFCSVECVRDLILETELDFLEKLGVLTEVVKDLRKYGIQDRLERPNTITGGIADFGPIRSERFQPGVINYLNNTDQLEAKVEQLGSEIMIVFFTDIIFKIESPLKEFSNFLDKHPEIKGYQFDNSVEKAYDLEVPEVSVFFEGEEVLVEEIFMIENMISVTIKSLGWLR